MVRALLFTTLVLLLSVAHADEYERQQIQKRIAPIGSVRFKAADTEKQSEQQTQAEQPKQVAKTPGEATYQSYCVTCHRTGLAGAPKFRNEADWKPLLVNRDIDALVVSAIKGKNAMPPKGTCVDCSEKDIKDAIEYMLPGKKQ